MNDEDENNDTKQKPIKDYGEVIGTHDKDLPPGPSPIDTPSKDLEPKGPELVKVVY